MIVGQRFVKKKCGHPPYALPEVPKQILSTKCAFLKVLMVLTDVSFEQTCNEPS